MNWSDVATQVSKAAPILGSLFPGVGTIAGVAVGAAASIAASALGVPADPDSISEAIKNDPDAFTKLRTAELENQAHLAELAVAQENNRLVADNALYASEAADRANARAAAIATPQDYTRQIITYLLLCIVGYVTYQIFSGALIDMIESRPITSSLIGTMLGYLMGEVKATLAYWFGATREGSQNARTALIAATSPGTVTVGNRRDHGRVGDTVG